MCKRQNQLLLNVLSTIFLIKICYERDYSAQEIFHTQVAFVSTFSKKIVRLSTESVKWALIEENIEIQIYKLLMHFMMHILSDYLIKKNWRM